MPKPFPGFHFDPDLKKLGWSPAHDAASYLLCHEPTVSPYRVCELLRVKRRPCTLEQALKALEYFTEDGFCMRLPANRFTQTTQMRSALWEADGVEGRLASARV